MSRRHLGLDALLGLNKYAIDDLECHITVDQRRCADCEIRPCLTVCPAPDTASPSARLCD